jgi:uncharacterized membrane protein
MKRLRDFALFVLQNFGPLVAFLFVNWRFGLLAAIAASMGVALVEVAVHLAHKKRPTRLFVMTTILTLAFGGVDLWMKRSVLFRFEAVITNVITGVWFGATLFGEKTMLLEFYEKTRKPEDPMPPETPSYLRLLTTIWTLYFFAKAALYAWIAVAFPLDRAIEIRAVVGTASFVALLGGERLVRKPFFRFLRDRGWIAAKSAPDAG